MSLLSGGSLLRVWAIGVTKPAFHSNQAGHLALRELSKLKPCCVPESIISKLFHGGGEKMDEQEDDSSTAMVDLEVELPLVDDDDDDLDLADMRRAYDNRYPGVLFIL